MSHSLNPTAMVTDGTLADFRVGVDTVIFSVDTKLHRLMVLLVMRSEDPFLGHWSLPGTLVRKGESLEQAADRIRAEKIHVQNLYLEQLYTFGDPGRSPGGRVVSVVYWALVESDEAALAVVDENVQWFSADHLPPLAFDHNLIVEYALWRLRTKVEYSRIAHAFLGETFTLAQLREVHEAVLQKALDPANFRRTIESSGTVVDTGQRVAGVPHRPPRLYRYNDSVHAVDSGALEPAIG